MRDASINNRAIHVLDSGECRHAWRSRGAILLSHYLKAPSFAATASTAPEPAASLNSRSKSTLRFAPVQWAAYRQSTAMQDVGVDHGGADVLVAEELLYSADVIACFEEVSSEGVAQGVA